MHVDASSWSDGEIKVTCIPRTVFISNKRSAGGGGAVPRKLDYSEAFVG